MYKFNSENIFTGYLKQLLASFPLPKYRVYTKEQEKYHREYLTRDIQSLTTQLQSLQSEKDGLLDLIKYEEENQELVADGKAKLKQVLADINKIEAELKPELNVIETKYRSVSLTYEETIDDTNKIVYPLRMRYVPYIKDGIIQEYVNGEWHKCHATLDNVHHKVHKPSMLNHIQGYTYGQKILNYTKTLKIQNNVYDSYTHEYLGDYLRFHRDFANINLMPLYNCFSNRACPKLNISFDLENNYKVNFNTDDKLYKYYMVPVKFFQDYTIAIDSEAAIEMCCCIYDQYQIKGKDTNHQNILNNISKITYQCFGDSQFRKPRLYSLVKNLNQFLSVENISELAQYEHALKLILKVPANNKSSIVILEGNYTAYNDISYTKRTTGTNLKNTDIQWNATEKTMIVSAEALANNAPTANAENRQLSNRTIINLGSPEAISYLSDKLITPLQLLRTNTGESYPFADRLIEYLVGNVITVNETNKDNVVRAKKVISLNCPNEIKSLNYEDGIWEPILQCLVYKYINDKHDTNDINHDILGYIDKDVEKVYTYTSYDKINNKLVPIEIETIHNIDIYK